MEDADRMRVEYEDGTCYVFCKEPLQIVKHCGECGDDKTH